MINRIRNAIYGQHSSFVYNADGTTRCFCGEGMDIAHWLLVHLPAILARAEAVR